LAKIAFYNQESLDVIDCSEKINAFITLGEYMDVVNDVLQLFERVLTILV
jgi:hypothetical protein